MRFMQFRANDLYAVSIIIKAGKGERVGDSVRFLLRSASPSLPLPSLPKSVFRFFSKLSIVSGFPKASNMRFM